MHSDELLTFTRHQNEYFESFSVNSDTWDLMVESPDEWAAYIVLFSFMMFWLHFDLGFRQQ